MRINNNNKQNFASLSVLAKPLNVFYNANATIPTLAIESGVTTLRSIEANKKGGKYEATERFIEQGISAAIWLWGVQTLKKAGEFIGEKFFKLGDLGFDVGFDELRNPIANNKINKNAAFYKCANILISTAIATYFIGFILPHLNRILTKKIVDKENKNKNKNKKDLIIKQPDFEEFKKQTSKNISFTSLYDGATLLAHTLENNSTARLLITDSGVIAGRYHNAKTKSHKIENLFRDISSIYFYLFSSSHIVKALNKLTSNADIDPRVLKETVSMLEKELKGKNTDKYNFTKIVSGESGIMASRRLDKLFKDRNIITLDEFVEAFPKFSLKAEKMTHLQPIFENKKYLTKLEAKDVLNKGLITEPEFLKKAMEAATKGASSNKLKFVSQKKLEKTRYSIDDFIAQIDRYLNKKDLELNSDVLKRFANKNIRKNFVFNVIGTILSTLALGILIPRLQYMIRKKLTNKDEFPGDVYYKK